MLEIEAMGSGKVLIVGHRGVRFHAPENTMVSFQMGYDLGSDTMELDIHMTRDGELVVMHDHEVSRTTDGFGPIGQMTLAEVKKLDAGIKFDPRFKGERVPTIEEVLAWAKERIQLAIEVKGGPHPAAGIEEKLINVLHQYGMAQRVMVISFFHTCVRRVKDIDPSISTGLLYVCDLVDPVAVAKTSKADSLRPAADYWTKEMIEKVHQAGIHVHAWPANDEKSMAHLISLGVDSFGTDYPHMAKKYLAERGLLWQS